MADDAAAEQAKKVDPRIPARNAADQAAVRAAIPADVLAGIFGGGSAGGAEQPAPPARWEEMVERSNTSQAEQAAALQAAGIAEQWEQLQEGDKWGGLIDSLGDGLTITEHICAGVDGNTIPLQFIRPPGTDKVPCAYYIHGGGMMMMSMRQGIFQTWGRLLARQGIAACMVLIPKMMILY